MTLHDYLRVARGRWKIVLFGLLAGMVTAAACTWSMPRQYSAGITIYISEQSGVNGISGPYQANPLPEQKVRSYTTLLAGTRVARDVANQLKLGKPADEIAGEISASGQPGTMLLTATVTDRSPLLAKEIADATGDAFTRLVAQLETPAANLPAAVSARVVEPAALPVDPVSPVPAMNFGLGVLLGLAAGYALALLRHALDTTVKSADELQTLTGAPNLGTIAHDADVPKHPLTVQEHSRSPRAEEFRKIRTNLQFIDVDRSRKAIVVTSAVPEEGKTTTLCNLAIVLARAGQRVVVVETDLRRPRAADCLGLEGAIGLTSVLSGRVTLDDALQSWGAALLDVLASGPIPPNPSELLASGQMANVLTELGRRYDMVLLDAPPLLPVTDAAIIGAACDGALLVVRHGRTTRNQLKAATSALDAVSARLLGTVLSMTPESTSNPYYEYYSALEETDPDLEGTAPIARIATGPRREPKRNGKSNGLLSGRLPVDALDAL
ncbi:polysaccharide biosynthesis tyrosine autokinase [Amycolatopsis taiwanensis]|uniref:non-specific protein-tyrosine kinase n=1 Tax=Amycolatopsis taiwanensis TaxID=342230 RepID=A0A9W6R881_9PSEU|nr:polysaccharide biosynthesis tyrosine autokinase [Amycolatopsis taiwanensis]GLY69250.1 chromosome partitioning protein [Amycolatopsis taiwanensis]